MFAVPDNLLKSPFDPHSTQDLHPHFLKLTQDHVDACPAYKKIINVAFPNYAKAQNIYELPYLPVSLFKHRSLRSAPIEDIRLSISSSGTSGSKKSKVSLSKEAAQLSAKALSYILQDIIGQKRKPMLIIDTARTLSNKGDLGARSAAILGLMPFGFDHTFALNNDLSLNTDKLKVFIDKHKDQDFIIYGFTSLIWDYFLPYCKKHPLDLTHSTLLHSGGWKHLADQNIDNDIFKTQLQKYAQIKTITNFYGMAEMPGIIYPEDKAGDLIIPNFSKVLIRDPHTHKVLEEGKEGLIQVFNPLAISYPGHSLLTEDIGVIYNKKLKIIGRAPKAELRGCSDVLAAA